VRNFDLATAIQIAGMLYLLMPLIVWISLRGERSHAAALWCCGGILFGVGTMLIGLRGQIPPWVSITVGNLLQFGAGMIRVQSLRLDLGKPWRTVSIMSAGLGYLVILEIVQVGMENGWLRLQFALLTLGLLVTYQAVLARRIGREQLSRNANWIAGVYFFLGGMVALRFIELIVDPSADSILIPHPTTFLLVVAGLLSAVIGNAAYIGVFLDRSRRLANMETLRLLSHALEQIPASVVITDAQANIQYVNAGFTKVTGYAATEVFGKNPRILQSGLTPREIYLEMWGKLRQGLSWGGEISNKRKNDEIYWEEANIAPVKNLVGVISHYVAVKTDITSRKQAVEALRVSEHRLRLLADNARDVIWNMTADGTITDISPSVEAVRGYTPEEAIHQTADQILTPDSQAIVLGFLTQMHGDMAAGRPLQSFRGELEYLCKDGSTFWGEVMAYPLFDADGIVQILGVTRDIAEHRRRKVELEEESRRLAEQITHMDRQRSMGEMAASLSHELNQPLTAILTNAQVAQRGMKANRLDVERVGEFLDKIIFNTRRAGEIIDKIRGFIRPADVTHLPVNLLKLVGDVINLVAPEAAENKVAIIVVPAVDPVWVKGDALQLSQVLINVYRNAIEALQRSVRREIHVRLLPIGDRVTLRISDSGPGLTPDMLQKVGTPFLTTKAGGLGLGLTIARSIIAQHQGALSVGNADGGGARIDIDLPLLSARAEVPA